MVEVLVAGITCQSTRVHNSRLRLRRSCSWSGHFYVMRHRRRRHKTILHHPKQFQGRLLHVSRETFRGAIRGCLSRWRNFVPSTARQILWRRFNRLLALYTRRFGSDEFTTQVVQSSCTPLPRMNWLPGGFANWRARIAAVKK